MLEVLVVDDNPDDGEFLRDLLSGIDDFSVRAVHSGQEALISLDECRVDCVLLDNRLDGEDGLAILAALRSKELFLPVVMIDKCYIFSVCLRQAEVSGESGAMVLR